MEKLSASNIIRKILREQFPDWLAVHETTELARTRGFWVSDNAAASRFSIELKGEIEGRYRRGTKYKEWRMLPRDNSAAALASHQSGVAQ